MPSFVVARSLSAHHLALPHDDVALLGAAAKDTLLRVVRDRVDLVVEELALEGGLIDRQMVILISLNIK